MKWRAGAIGLAAVITLVVLIGCGGGGGGSSTTPHVYTGVSTAAPLDNTLEAGQMAYGILAASVAGAVGTLQLSPASAQQALLPFSAKAAVLRAVRRVIPSAGVGNGVLSRAVYPPEYYYGAESGTLTVTITTGVWTNTQTEYVTRIDVTFQSFDDVVDGVANPIDGTMSIVPDSWLANGYPVYFVATFDLNMTFAPGASGRITGTLDYDQVSREVGHEDLRHIYTWTNTLISDEQTALQIWWNPLVEIDEDITEPRALLTITGKVYLSPYGFVTIDTLEPFDYPTGMEVMPVSGQFLLTGYPGKATITVPGPASDVFVELDQNGDGSIDSSQAYFWDELVI